MSLNVTSNIGVINYNNNSGKFVIVSGNSIYSSISTNGINWIENKISNTSRYLNSVCYGNDKFVAVDMGYNTSNTFVYSTDGITWTEGTISDTRIAWYSICYGNEMFVTVPVYGNLFAYSSDGINWSEGAISDTKRYWGSICYGNDKFVSVSRGSNYFAYSTNGITWTEGTISSTSRDWTSVCYGNGKYVAVADNTNYFAYSTDGINWTEGTISDTSRNWESVCYGNDKFVAVGYNKDSENNLISGIDFAYSTDGINWTEGFISNTGRQWTSVCYGNDKYVAVAFDSSIFAYSSDGMNWTEINFELNSRQWTCICFGLFPTPDKAFNLSQPENASITEFSDKVILDSIVHHDSPMYLLINQKTTDNNFYIHSPILGDITLTSSDRLIYPVNSNMNRNCIGGKLHPLGNGYVAYSVYSNNMDATSKFSDSDTGSLELITGVIKANPYLGYYKSVNGQGFYGSENDEDGFMESYRKVNVTNYNIEFSNNHTGISSDVTDVNGISSMTTYTEQYTEDVYYIHYAWVDRASSSLVRYNILTRKIDTSSGTPVISNVSSYTTTFSIGTIAHPSFHKDKNGIHCAFYHGNTTYTKYYKLTRSGTDDSTWSWGVDSNTYITNENISLMVNKNENNLQSSLAQSARRMYMVNSNDKLVEFKKSQIF